MTTSTLLNQRALRARRRDLLRALGMEIRRMREDAGRSQSVIASTASISQAHLSTVEAGAAEPSVEVLIAIAAALGAHLSIRLFPGSGPRVRDHIQVAMSEALLAALHPRWRAAPEVPVYRPIRGVIDLVLEDRPARVLVATELQSQLRRVEQQVRWATQKADALAALPEHAAAAVDRLLVLRNTAATREVTRSASATLAAAYPGRAAEALASLAGTAPWPGATLLWATVERGRAHLMDGPPRGITVGR
jgi:transcriptional regulator with XRE-family HTH domain